MIILNTVLFLATLTTLLYPNEAFEQNHEVVNLISNSQPENNPIIFIPGDGGSQLQARLNKTSHKHYFCPKKSDWFNIWVNIHLLVPKEIDCLSDNMMLYYNRTNRTTYNTPGVEIRPNNFGQLESVAYLDNYRVPYTDYFENLISTIEKQNGLVRNINMFGAPFDFRKAPNELGVFFTNLTKLLEETYVKNNYGKVTLICHSMGCLNSVYFLNRKTKLWKDTFIKRLITLAAPWDGAVSAICAILFGDTLGIPLINKQKLQSLQSTFPSLMYLLPKTPTFTDNRTLIETRSKNYTLNNLNDFFEAIGMLNQREMWHDTREIALNLKAPNVELWCLHGSGVQTPSKIIFKGSIHEGEYTIMKSDGDGTVNLESLGACKHFAKQQEKPVNIKMFDGAKHIDTLRGKEVAQFISNRILLDNQKRDSEFL